MSLLPINFTTALPHELAGETSVHSSLLMQSIILTKPGEAIWAATAL